MTKTIFADRAQSTLASAASIGDTSITIQSDDADDFGAIDTDEELHVLLESIADDSVYEIVTVTGRSSAVLTCSALTKDWTDPDDTEVTAVLTKAAMDEFIQEGETGLELSGHVLADYKEKYINHGTIANDGILSLDWDTGTYHKCHLAGDATIEFDVDTVPEPGYVATKVIEVTGTDEGSITWSGDFETDDNFPASFFYRSQFIVLAGHNIGEYMLSCVSGQDLGGDNVNDNFTGDDGDAPNPDLWEVTNNSASGTAQINSNKLRFVIPNTASDESLYILSKFKLSGPFDIQIDYDEISNDAPSADVSYPSRLRLDVTDGDVYTIGSYFPSVGNHLNFVLETGGSNVFSSALTSQGKYRFTRTSDGTITAYLWSGTQWEWDGDTSGHEFSTKNTEDCAIRIPVLADFDSGATTDFDNFQVNSGTIVWP